MRTQRNYSYKLTLISRTLQLIYQSLNLNYYNYYPEMKAKTYKLKVKLNGSTLKGVWKYDYKLEKTAGKFQKPSFLVVEYDYKPICDTHLPDWRESCEIQNRQTTRILHQAGTQAITNDFARQTSTQKSSLKLQRLT